MRDEDWESLIYSIQRGRCILMLGPLVATETVGGGERPLVELLSEELAEKLDGMGPGIDRTNLLQIAEQYRIARRASNLDQHVWSFYNTRKSATCPAVFNDLAAIPFQTILTTSHDDFLERSFNAREGKMCNVDFYHSGRKRPLPATGSVEAPLIYQLYGSIEEERSLVLSETGLLDYLVSVIGEKPALPDALRAELQETNRSFLFLGFDFAHWQMRILLHVLHGNDRASRSLALDAFGGADSTSGQSHSFFYGEGYGINFENTGPAEFVQELRARYEAIEGGPSSSKQSKDAVAEPPPDAPSVFLCHASEDAEAAATLANQLRAGGLRPWLDKEQIRGGARWDDLIDDTIRSVDYFVVLQSEAMVRQFESYFLIEIASALKRTRGMRKDLQIAFVIPAALDDCERLSDLDEYQTHDLASDPDAAGLIKIIRRDWQRRNR